jgi:hypothetical protein
MQCDGSNPIERYGFLMKPNFRQDYRYLDSNFTMIVETNSLGLRDEKYDLEAIYVGRIFLLGDSFTFGDGLMGISPRSLRGIPVRRHRPEPEWDP